MKRSALFHAIVLVIPILLLVSGCGRTVDPGKRGLRWSPLSGGLDEGVAQGRVLLEGAMERCVRIRCSLSEFY